MPRFRHRIARLVDNEVAGVLVHCICTELAYALEATRYLTLRIELKHANYHPRARGADGTTEPIHSVGKGSKSPPSDIAAYPTSITGASHPRCRSHLLTHKIVWPNAISEGRDLHDLVQFWPQISLRSSLGMRL
jgi:hypothetical protein